MGIVKNLGTKIVDHLDDLATGTNLDRLLVSNNGINGFAAMGFKGQAFASMTSPLEAISRYHYGGQGYGVTDALAETFLKDAGKQGARNWALTNLSLKKAGGAVVGTGVGMGVIGGLTHDSAGNPDIAGIPGI